MIPINLTTEQTKALCETLRQVLADHWLAAMICDHENQTDKAICSCSRVNLPVMNSVGASAATWVGHVMTEFEAALAARQTRK